MEFKIGQGKIKYRLPNYAESQIILGEIGIGTKKDDASQNEFLIILGKITAKLGEFISEVKVKDYNKFDELLNDPELGHDLTKLANEFISRIFEFTTQKKS